MGNLANKEAFGQGGDSDSEVKNDESSQNFPKPKSPKCQSKDRFKKQAHPQGSEIKVTPSINPQKIVIKTQNIPKPITPQNKMSKAQDPLIFISQQENVPKSNEIAQSSSDLPPGFEETPKLAMIPNPLIFTPQSNNDSPQDPPKYQQQNQTSNFSPNNNNNNQNQQRSKNKLKKNQKSRFAPYVPPL